MDLIILNDFLCFDFTGNQSYQAEVVGVTSQHDATSKDLRLLDKTSGGAQVWWDSSTCIDEGLQTIGRKKRKPASVNEGRYLYLTLNLIR